MAKNTSLVIRENTEDKSDILKQIHKLSQTLNHKTTPNQHIIAYTDGSTETKKRKSKNSGYGIHVTTNSHFPIYNGGGTVRSDGNNFVAEMAAATVGIKAHTHTLPPNRILTIYVDSVAAIQALEQGLISERKRIKAQGRAWKSFIRPTIAEKRHHISIFHVKAHSGLESPEQQGNDCADKMAKKFMNLAESMDPLPYFTTAEEKYHWRQYTHL